MITLWAARCSNYTYMFSKLPCPSFQVEVLLLYRPCPSVWYMVLANYSGATVLLNKREHPWFSCRPSFPFWSLASWTWCRTLVQSGGRIHICKMRLEYRCTCGPLLLESKWWIPRLSRSLILAVQMGYLEVGCGWNLWIYRMQWCWLWLISLSKR